jgi:uncharacterized membrane protein
VRNPLCFLLLLASLFPHPIRGQTPVPVVHAIIFYSPTCPHCHEVITQHLIPLQNQYGNRLVLMGFDTSQQWANNLYWEAIRFYKLPEADWVVPIMVVGEEVLIGGIEIPGRFPAMIETGLAGDGIDLPDFPALITLLRQEGTLDTRYPDRRIAVQSPQAGATEPAPAADSAAAGDSTIAEAVADTVAGDTAIAEAATDTTGVAAGDPAGAGGAPTQAAAEGAPAGLPAGKGSPVSPQGRPVEPPTTVGGGAARAPLGMEEVVQELESRTMRDRFLQDPAGNSLSVIVLLGMLVSLALTGFPPRVKRGEWPAWVLPALVLIGTGVAAYLSYIEITQVEATCGPVGDCNTVNQSEYAILFGFLPVGVLGLVGYALIFLLWVLGRSGPAGLQGRATLGIWAAALFGTFFSAYLTFLEPFVIGATCIWCLTSAVVMTLLLWYAAPRARRVWPGVGDPAVEG